MSRKNKSTSNTSPNYIKRELMAFLCLLIAGFYYLCLLSYHPADPSFLSSTTGLIANRGGIVGSYLAGFFFFLFGGASYFFGLYFLLNSVLLFIGKRERLSWIDFVVYLISTIFVAIFLQLQWQEISIDYHAMSAGGAIGEILGQFGAQYLGKWGIYLLVVFGAIVTFILATRLSVIKTLNLSTKIFGKGLLSFIVKVFQGFSVFKKLALSLSEKITTFFKKQREAKISHAAEAKAQPKKKLASSVSIDRVLKEPKQGPKIKKRKDDQIKRPTAPKQLELTSHDKNYQLPTTDYLHAEEVKVKIDEASLKMSAKILEKKLLDFGIEGEVTEIHPGPVITMYEFQPAPGVKVSRIHSLSDDLSLAMGGRPVRIVAPLPNKPAVGIEIPNHDRETVWLKEIIEDEKFQNHESKMVFALGKDIEGFSAISDLKKMPHLLVAGATGSGKSVAVNSMITSILYKARPDEVRMIMIDPKMIELSIYEGIPHLLLPVVTDPNKANLALKWAVREMERRYQLLADINARNINTYNKKIETGELKTGKASQSAMKNDVMDEDDNPIIHEGKLPYIVVIVDEFADLMMVASKEVEASICRLAQKARAAGIHVILATQRPSVDVITGIIKANFPSRISFKVSSRHDSRTILDGVGAEQLLGMGDMLFIPPGSGQSKRLHGAYIDEDEITKIVEHAKNQAKPVYNEEILKPVESVNGSGLSEEDFDEYYDQAVREVVDAQRVSISSIQRKFRIGYNRAARIVELMEQQGVVSAPNSQGQREVIVEQ